MPAGRLIGTNWTEEGPCEADVNLMEVVLPDIPVPMTGFPEPGLLIVKGYEVGGLTIVVAVARGMLAPVNNGVLVLAGGLDVVKTVTYLKGGKVKLVS